MTEPQSIDVIRGHLSGDAPLDTAVSRAILRRVDAGELPETIQVGMPHRVVAFGKHDTLGQGFTSAVDIASRLGYEPSIRIAGGRAVVFHPGTVRFSWTIPTTDPASTMHARFHDLATAVVAALADLGIATEIGELPREYCAGTYSVHLSGGGKVMGVGQRLSRRAAQVGGMIVVNDAAAVNRVLTPIYHELDIDMDPSMTASLAEHSAVSPTEVAAVLVDHLLAGRPSRETSPDHETIAMAAVMRPDHDPRRVA